ncbi:hypothetical protein CAS74_003379 [Pichia kudriavzevii]|uniref:Retrograde transport protein Dsl1 C-terminal domain-containing protein n=1 Tax=Pichia kudriavzevii TaxID=4909 RepID=A0A1Z8JKZ8_PICKU|nr:hypothetical protein CAS74_003379 [Pichia kudriavzevii]
MEKHDIDISESLKTLNLKLKELDKKIQSYSSGSSRKGETLMTPNSHPKQFSRHDINETVEVCNQLWVVNGLIDDYKQSTNFTDKLKSFYRLQKKIDQIKSGYMPQSEVSQVKIFGELDNLLISYQTELNDTSNHKFQEYFNIREYPDIKIFPEVDGVLMNEFFKLTRGLLSVKINEHFNIAKIFNNLLNTAFDKFDDGFVVEMEKNVLHFEKSEYSFFGLVNSVQQVICFIDYTASLICDIPEYSNFRYILGKTILRELRRRMFDRKNVYLLIVEKLGYDDDDDDDNGNKYKVTMEQSSIAVLYKIASQLSTEGWSTDGICDLEFWIDDLITSWVDNLVDGTVDEFKILVLRLIHKEFEGELNENNLITVEIGDDYGKESAALNADGDKDGDGDCTDKKEVEGKLDQSDLGLELEDDGGWDVDEELDLDSISEASQKGKAKIDDDDWGAWEEEVDLELDDATSRNLNKTTFKYSPLVLHLLKVIERYMMNYTSLKELGVSEDQVEDSKALFKQGLKKLCTSYFMMIESQLFTTYKNSVLFYNDFNKLLEECGRVYDIDFTNCHKMNLSFINEYVNDKILLLVKVLDDYALTIWNDDELITEFLIRFNSQFDEVFFELSKLSHLNKQLVVNTLITITFQVSNNICNRITCRKDISSFESNILSNIIDSITQQLEQKVNTMGIKAEGIQSWTNYSKSSWCYQPTLKVSLMIFTMLTYLLKVHNELGL